MRDSDVMAARRQAVREPVYGDAVAAEVVRRVERREKEGDEDGS